MSAGYRTLAFHDEFDSPDISVDGGGEHVWYPSGFFSPTLPPSGYTWDGGVLDLLTDVSTWAQGLSTAAPGHPGRTFRRGYFEARMRFDANGFHPGTRGWPAFWTWPLQHGQGQIPDGRHFDELDVIEAWPTHPLDGGVNLLTTIHQWTVGATGGVANEENNVLRLAPDFDKSGWHTYGCLWVSGRLTWFIDDVPVTVVDTGPGTRFDAIDDYDVFLILGTGVNWTTSFDYVRVWQ